MAVQVRISGKKVAVSEKRAALMRRVKSVSEYSVQDVRRCLQATVDDVPDKELAFVCRNAKLTSLVKNPLSTIRMYKNEMKACLKCNNADAHYIEGIKQYFAFNNSQLGLKHLKKSAENNSAIGNYLYALIALVTGYHEEGQEIMSLHKWERSTTEADKCWRRVRRSLRDVPITPRDEYGTNMMLVLPPRSCEPDDPTKESCNKCFLYRQMKKFMEMIHRP